MLMPNFRSKKYSRRKSRTIFQSRFPLKDFPTIVCPFPGSYRFDTNEQSIYQKPSFAFIMKDTVPKIKAFLSMGTEVFTDQIKNKIVCWLNDLIGRDLVAL
ncbi:unnamed protein product [Mucor hiemalis]